MREDDRTHIAPVANQARRLVEGPLTKKKCFPNSRQGRDFRGTHRDFFCTDGITDKLTIEADIASGKFVTFCYTVIDLEQGVITYANAGHNPPLVVRADGRVDQLAPTGLVLGVSSDWTYTTGTTTFHPGDRLICYTDGMTEARSGADEEFGEERLAQMAVGSRDQSVEALADALIAAVTAWTSGPAQDDATLIVVARSV